MKAVHRMLGRLGGAHLDRYADLFDDDLYADRLDVDARTAREFLGLFAD